MGLEEFAVPEGSELSAEQEIARGDYWKPGTPAKHKHGIAYKAPWETLYDGVCIAARRHARALRLTGIPVFLMSDSFTHANQGVVTEVEYYSLPEQIRAEVQHLVQPEHGESLLMIRHCVPTRNAIEALVYPQVAKFLNQEQLSIVRRATILFAAFETNRVDEDIARYLNMLGRVWVTCDANKLWLTESGVAPERIQVVPHPFYSKDPMAQPRGPRGDHPFRFLNVSKWEPRKAQHDLIGGFLLAFGPGDNIELVLKCSPYARVEGYPIDWVTSVAVWAEDSRVKQRGWTKDAIHRHLKVLWKVQMTRAELAQLYRECDVYVSTGRAEGFDLPAFDAKLLGMRLVHANSGGPEMFHCHDDILIGPVDVRAPFHPMYDVCPEATWAGFNEIDVGLALGIAYERREYPVSSFDRSRYTMKAVGAVMRQSCNDLMKELGTDISGINIDAVEK